MRELRSVANALFCFFLFLLIYAFLVPGHAKGTSGPRFLRMEIVDSSVGSTHPDRLSFSVPFGLVRCGLRAAVGGRVRREFAARFDESIDADDLRSLWKELAEKPEGTEVTRTYDETKWTFVRSHGTVTITVPRQGSEDDAEDRATIRVPAAILEGIAGRDRSFDVDALLSELSTSAAGSLLEIDSRDGRLKVWIE